jgi:hypothetical protein
LLNPLAALSEPIAAPEAENDKSVYIQTTLTMAAYIRRYNVFELKATGRRHSDFNK